MKVKVHTDFRYILPSKEAESESLSVEAKLHNFINEYPDFKLHAGDIFRTMFQGHKTEMQIEKVMVDIETNVMFFVIKLHHLPRESYTAKWIDEPNR